jgi:hypothetical protein
VAKKVKFSGDFGDYKRRAVQEKKQPRVKHQLKKIRALPNKPVSGKWILIFSVFLSAIFALGRAVERGGKLGIFTGAQKSLY